MEKERRCLRCDRPFVSTGPGNRICGRCKDRDSQTIMQPISDSARRKLRDKVNSKIGNDAWSSYMDMPT